MKRKMWALIIGALIVLFLVIGFFANLLVVNDVTITKTDANGESITIDGFFNGSAPIYYAGNLADYKDGMLRLKIIGIGLVRWPGARGDFNISITKKNGNVETIYLWNGNKEKSVLIWPKNKNPAANPL